MRPVTLNTNFLKTFTARDSSLKDMTSLSLCRATGLSEETMHPSAGSKQSVDLKLFMGIAVRTHMSHTHCFIFMYMYNIAMPPGDSQIPVNKLLLLL